MIYGEHEVVGRVDQPTHHTFYDNGRGVAVAPDLDYGIARQIAPESWMPRSCPVSNRVVGFVLRDEGQPAPGTDDLMQFSRAAKAALIATGSYAEFVRLA